MSRAALAAALLVLAGAVSACGDDGGSGAPTDASVEEFCEAHLDGAVSFLTYRDEPEGAEDAMEDALRAWGDEVAAMGTPEGIPDDARAGFETLVDRARDGQLRAGEKAGEPEPEVAAFDVYVAETCGAQDELGLPEAPSLPTE